MKFSSYGFLCGLLLAVCPVMSPSQAPQPAQAKQENLPVDPNRILLDVTRVNVLFTSNSIRDRFKFEQAAAVEFINSTVRPREDKAMLVSFDSATELVADLTDNPEVLAKAVRSLRPGGGTSLYDAIFYACKDKLQLDQPRDKFRRAMVIVSDGDDNQSRVTTRRWKWRKKRTS